LQNIFCIDIEKVNIKIRQVGMRIYVSLFMALLILGNSEGFSAQKDNYMSKIQPDELKWVSNPALPNGILVAVLFGDPNKDGPHVMRLKIPADTKIAPHWHPIPENITVLSGSINVGHGDKFDQQNGVHLPTGSFVSIPARHHHFAWFTEDTVLQLNDFGHWQIFYLNPKDDPRSKQQAFSDWIYQ
jgi:hypothetical protein